MKAPKQIIVKRAYIIPSVGCTNSDHDILITRLHTAEFLVNNRRHTRRAALDQPRVAATTRMDKEQFGNTNTPGKESDAADISSVKRRIIDLDNTPRSNIELFQQVCRDFANSPSIQLHLNDTHQAIEQLVYTNSEPWADHEDDTDAAAGPRKAVKKSTEAQSFSLTDTERYWKLKFPKYNRDYSDASLIHFAEHRNFMITDLDIKDPRSINQLEDHIKIRREMDQAIRKFIQSRSIAEAIEKRHECIQSIELDPTQIKQEVEKHIKTMFRKRICNFDDMSEEWKRYNWACSIPPFSTDACPYEPIKEYRDAWREAIEPITLGEWLDTLAKLNTGTAVGPSGIDYRVIRLFLDDLHKLIIDFVNITIRVGIIPDYWKQSYLCPFPKPNRFDYDLNNIRPIMLLDTIRKSATKLDTERINTTTPLTILNSLIEGAKEQGKELHVVTQDIKKAYDSVSIDSLGMALDHLNMPTDLTK
ncbi:hypothetical protein RclHR1_22340001 [Rhizophagus clarus]|uniref:Reverse transcriptase domain-containing protein n=1 Tax=Rhizophagus clarus TaxID=94130 RepID=A0A2Z6QV01_9GLOM|nr:hypothetical protein RclHR1_22340001 [Rhizophagus clarus]